MTITPHIFGAYLKCPMKCWLRATNVRPTGNAYAEWLQTETELYHLAEAKRLVTPMPSGEYALAPRISRGGEYDFSLKDLKAVKWRLAIDVSLSANASPMVDHPLSAGDSPDTQTSSTPNQNSKDQSAWLIESNLHAIERIPSEGRGRPTTFIPLRFVFKNKIDNDDRMLLSFDALALSKLLARPIAYGKIIHGDNHTTLKIKTAGMASRAQMHVKKIATLLSNHLPPDLSLNRHCNECEFREHCHKLAIEKDDLSLLSNMSEKERQKLRAKGIFTVTQLSYTFRPRRRAKSRTEKSEKYHQSLKALSIRENRIHVVGSPELKIKGTPVYLDVEGVPDCESYYLIGLRIGNHQSVIQRNLWANETDGEQQIWNEFLAILANTETPVLIHYGSYETTFLARMRSRYGIPSEFSSLAEVVEHTINLVSIIFAKVYYPTYSNGLKDIARYLNFQWSNTDASGLTSIVWRHQWIETRSDDLLQKLTTYNAEDCAALERVTDSVRELCEMKTGVSTAGKQIFVDVDSLKREKIYPFKTNEFAFPALEQINKAGYWDYQRNRIYLRTDKRVKAAVHNTAKTKLHSVKVNQTIELHERPSVCEKCGGHHMDRSLRKTKIVHDLKFSKSGIKRWIIKYCFSSYRCRFCHSTTSMPDKPWTRSMFGLNLRSYVLYQIIELRMSQTSISRSLKQLFGMSVAYTFSYCQKSLGSRAYDATYKKILSQIISGSFLHADETKVSIDRHNAYVWVFANHNSVAYVYADSREAGMLQELLRDFKGVLISDFYAAYDLIDCPQQKCLIHLVRDMNDDVLKEPFNDELQSMVREFSELLKSIVETIDRFGLKAWFLRKHKKQVERFYGSLLKKQFTTEVAIKYQKRFEKNAGKLFTFLDYDNVPWNNNNAEHAIKPFAMLRHNIGGVSTPKGIRDYLVLLSVEETCKYRGISFLEFLRSGELDIDKFSSGSRSRLRVGISPTSP